jgi:disulfide oxidoreductase YuzD
MKKFFVLLFVLSVNIVAAQTDNNWALKQDKDGVKIYTAKVPDSKVKAIKVECELDATLSQAVAVVMDIKNSKRWVYRTASAYIIKRSSPSDLYYYSLVKMPFPVSNRDFIAHLIVKQDPKTKVVTIDGPCVANMVPQKKKVVRVTNSTGRWLLTPDGANHVKIVYTLHADPAGSIPSWLTNMFITQGPSQSFKKLKVEIQKPVYKNAKLAYVKNL